MSFMEDNQIPSYIPKVRYKTLAEWGVNLNHIIIDLNHAELYKKTLPALREYVGGVLIDPVSHKNFFDYPKTQVSFTSIGYEDIEPELLYSEKRHRTDLIEKSIGGQIASGADAIIIPYLFSPDTDDTKFSVNLTLLSESLIYIQEQGIELPIFAKICVHSRILTRPLAINNIVSRYCDDHAESLEGVIVSVTDFDGRKADLGQLLGFANLVHQLQAQTKVIVATIGGFGEVLLALGASAFSSGINESEGITVKQLQEGSKVSKSIHTRIYIPEVMGYLNYEEATNIGYQSSSDGCEIDFTQAEPTSQQKQRHYLNARLRTIDSLNGLNRDEKITFLIGQLSSAQTLLTQYADEHGVYIRDQYHPKWIQVLQQAQGWSDPATDSAELEALLEEIDKEDD